MAMARAARRSTMPLTVPIAAWIRIMPPASVAAAATVPPATTAIPAVAAPSSRHGNGWVTLISPSTARARPLPGDCRDAAPSDVDELVEVDHQVLDEPIPAVVPLRPDAGDERVERDRGDHH